jgi:putative transposase
VLESYVTKTSDKAVALKFIKKVIKRHPAPEVIVTGGLKANLAALSQLRPLEKQVKGRRLNPRA